MPRVKREDGAERDAVRDYEGGMNMRTVGILYRVGHRTLRGWLDAAGVEVRRREIVELDRGVVEGMLREGESLRGVGRRLGVGRGRLRRLLGDGGIA